MFLRKHREAELLEEDMWRYVSWLTAELSDLLSNIFLSKFLCPRSRTGYHWLCSEDEDMERNLDPPTLSVYDPNTTLCLLCFYYFFLVILFGLCCCMVFVWFCFLLEVGLVCRLGNVGKYFSPSGENKA